MPGRNAASALLVEVIGFRTLSLTSLIPYKKLTDFLAKAYTSGAPMKWARACAVLRAKENYDCLLPACLRIKHCVLHDLLCRVFTFHEKVL
jgi:hypothetical protein